MRALIACAVMVVAVAIGLFRLLPPAADDPNGFVTANAVKNLQVIAKEPRPVESQANAAVREYIVQQCTSMGLEVRVQSVSATLRGHTWKLNNIVAKLKGTGNLNGAIMLSAHHDSVRPGPGAGDDGAAVASMLEVARKLSLDRPKRDVIFLITDGEEAGLLGAQVYAPNGPSKNEVALDFNFDARGTSGPSAMFQTSGGNSWLIDQYALAARHPITTSLAGEVYRRMPNGTDFQVFIEHGFSGLNFAFIGSYANYHTARDDIDHLSERTLRHTGTQMLAMARHFGNLEQIGTVSSQVKNPVDDVYFDVLGMAVVHYPEPYAPWLSLIGIAAAAIAMWSGLRSHTSSIGGTLIGFVIVVVGLALSSTAIWGVTRLFDPRRAAVYFDAVYGAEVALVVLIAIVLIGLLKRWISIGSFATGSILLWSILAVLASLWIPGGSYLFLIPLVLVSIALIALASGRGAMRFVIVLICCAACLALNAGHIYLAALGLTLEGAFITILLPALFIWLIVPIVWIACVTPPSQQVAVQDLQPHLRSSNPQNP